MEGIAPVRPPKESRKRDASASSSSSSSSKPPRKRARRTKKDGEPEADDAPTVGGAAAGADVDAAEGAAAAAAAAAAARRAHQKTLTLNRLYGDPAEPERTEAMHVNTGHALMRVDDVFYLHPLSEDCLVQRGSVPCPDPSRSETYLNTLQIRPTGPCMHCDRECTAGRIPLPRAYDQRRRTYAVWGNFCSFPCAMGYQMDHGAGMYDTPTVLMLIQKMAAEVWGREGLVRPAPPRFCLRKFGGPVDPEDIEALSERQQQTVVEAPFISWAMMVDCKSVDAVSRTIKRVIGQPAETRAATATATACSVPPCADPAAPPTAVAALNAAAIVEEEARRTETDEQAYARIARAWNLRGLPAHDPNMEHPGALCRDGGVTGIHGSANRGAQAKAPDGAAPSPAQAPAWSNSRLVTPPAPASGTAGDADEGGASASGETMWDRFYRARVAASAASAAATADATSTTAAT
jgi:hypothetical protein